MTTTKKISTGITLFAVILAFIVVTLGAYTRLTDAGLGCPDWPGCYDQVIAPTTTTEIQKADSLYPAAPVHVTKAWTEMVHRYVAGILGLVIFGLGIVAIRRRKVPGQAVIAPVILMALVIFQALLGKWTVTMKLLPVVVMGHLLGGFSILALLWWCHLKSGNYFISLPRNSASKFKFWAILGLVIVTLQIILGGWTSTNYAALVCLNFPYCTVNEIFPQVDFHSAFNFFNVSNIHLSYAALVTIQMSHRFGALVTGLYVGILSICLIALRGRQLLRRLGIAMLVILIAQICLGILNIKLLLPLYIAVLHNVGAAFLLLSMVTLVYVSFTRTIGLTQQ